MLIAWNCGILINGAVTVHNGRAYVFGLRDPAVHAATDPADRATFLTMLESVRSPSDAPTRADDAARRHGLARSSLRRT